MKCCLFQNPERIDMYNYYYHLGTISLYVGWKYKIYDVYLYTALSIHSVDFTISSGCHTSLYSTFISDRVFTL